MRGLSALVLGCAGLGLAMQAFPGWSNPISTHSPISWVVGYDPHPTLRQKRNLRRMNRKTRYVARRG